MLAQDARYPRLIREWAALAGILGTAVSMHNAPGCVRIGAYSKHWPCLFPQVGAGAKHLRVIALEPWQITLAHAHPEALLRGLIESDGSRHSNRVVVRGKPYVYGRYQFTNRSDDIRDIFRLACDELGVRYTACGPYTLAVSRKSDVALLDTFIGRKS